MDELITGLQALKNDRSEAYDYIDQLIEVKKQQQRTAFEELEYRTKRHYETLERIKSDAMVRDAHLEKEIATLGMLKNKLAGTEPLPLVAERRDEVEFEDKPRRRRWWLLGFKV